jgi:hypothetical protein
MLTHMKPMLDVLSEECTAAAFEFGHAGTVDLGLFDVLSLEIKKSLMKRGASLDFLEMPCFLEFDDRLIQLPAIIHKSSESLAQTISVYQELLSRLTSERPASLVSINLALALPEHTLNLSVFGSLEDVKSWFERPAPFPLSGAIEDWVRSTSESLENVEESSPTEVTNVEPKSLVLFPRRRRQATDLDTIRTGERTIDIGAIPIEVTKAIEEKRLRLAVATRIRIKECSSCSKDYFQCSCSWLFDDGVDMPASDTAHGYTYWSI